MITYLESIYGPTPVKQGNNYTYMGMDMEFTERIKVKVSTMGHINQVVDEPPEYFTKPVVSLT